MLASELIVFANVQGYFMIKIRVKNWLNSFVCKVNLQLAISPINVRNES